MASSTTSSRERGGALSIQQVSKVYDPEHARVVALDRCTIDIAAGAFVAVVGPSGCGKSTLLNILAGFDAPTAGTVLLNGAALATPDAPASPGADRVVVFQRGALFHWMTVLDNVIYGLVRQGRMRGAEARAHGIEFLDRCGGLSNVADHYPSQLSSGMQRRVELVRALINDPQILLLDEPFRAMDTANKKRMHRHLLDMHELFPKTVLFITHDLEEAIYLADTVFVMTSRPGRIKLRLEVKLPRPRESALISSPAFTELKRAAIVAVHEEAKKAFESGERELA
jgi:NitT/TauT family transport system ATP-binding protein